MTWAGLKNQTRKYSLSMYKGPSSGRRPTWNACFCLLSCSQSNWELPQLGSIMLATALWPKWGHFYSWYFDNKADIVHMILPAVSLQRQNFNTDLSIRKHAGPPLSHFPRIATNSFHGFQRTFLCSHVWHGIEITIFFVLDYKKNTLFFLHENDVLGRHLQFLHAHSLTRSPIKLLVAAKRTSFRKCTTQGEGAWWKTRVLSTMISIFSLKRQYSTRFHSPNNKTYFFFFSQKAK